MAKQLAGEASSFVRVFTDPVTGTGLNMEEQDPPHPEGNAALAVSPRPDLHVPGCNRPAMQSDVDHTEDVQYGGVTANGNLARLCRKHHTLKHKSNWRYVQPPAAEPGARPKWTSPLGHTTGSDPHRSSRSGQLWRPTRTGEWWAIPDSNR